MNKREFVGLLAGIPLASLLLSACGGGAVETASSKFKSRQPVKVALIGNSIGCGWYATGWENLVHAPNDQLIAESRVDSRVRSAAIQVRELLMARNPESDLINLSGDAWDTSDHLGTGRFPGADTVGDAIQLKADVVFIALQVVDCCIHRIPFKTFASNTRIMVQRLLDAGIQPVLVKENYVAGTFNGLTLQDFVAEIDVITAEKSVTTINMYAAFRAALASTNEAAYYHDPLHPNGAGHDLLFKQYAEWLDKYAESLDV